MSLETWVLLMTVVVLAWLYSRWRHRYWARRGISSPPALPFIGHFNKSYLVNPRLWKTYEENYRKFYSSRMYGLYEFFRPILVINDPEILKHVLVKDFEHFSNRRSSNLKASGSERDRMSSEMVALKNGEEWKGLRSIVTPVFTSGKIKSMFPLVCDKADALVRFSMKEASEKPHVNMKKNFGRYTIDTIATCAFGIESNSLIDENSEFFKHVDSFFGRSPKKILKGLTSMFMPRLFKLLGLSVRPPSVDFFIDVVEHSLAARRAGKTRGDFIDLLLEAKQNSSKPDSKYVMSDMTIVAQCVLFIIAGYDTTAALLAFTSYLLAKHKDQQQRLREEVQQVMEEHNGLTYHGIMEAKLLDACLQETLRIYPAGIMLERECSKTYRLPGTDLTLQPGDLVHVPVWNLHHDSRYWPDPEAFIPDRFLPKNKNNNNPYTHMPFSLGPRNCIAMRFALLETKVARAKLLLEAELELAPGYEELVLETSKSHLRAKHGIMLVLKPVKRETRSYHGY